MELRSFKLILPTIKNISNFTTGNATDAMQSQDTYQTVEMVIIVLVTGSLSFVTITGNILVLLSITINRNLQTINNYFIFSLACADLIIGITSMNLDTVDTVVGYWPLGPAVCDLWMVVDYAVGWVSVLNLLIISFDRYFCITRPLSYPAKRTTRIAGMMIAATWVLAFLLWAPPILFWQFVVGERTVPDKECYAQFLYDATINFITSIVYFFLPITIMIFLYWQISRSSKSRMKKGKQEPKQDNLSSSKAGNHITMPSHDNSVKTHCAEWSQNGGTGGVGEKESSPQVHPDRNEIAEAPANYKGNPIADSQITTNAKQCPKKKALPSREKKVTRTVMAILVAFVVLWTPYCVMVLINAFCSTCISENIWMLCYWLGYANSTINPACYALCSVTFRKTFKQLLLCQHKDIRLGG